MRLEKLTLQKIITGTMPKNSSMSHSIKKNTTVLLLASLYLLGGCAMPGQQEGELPAFLTNTTSWLPKEEPKETPKATQGTKNFEDGVHYEGDFKDGMRHGHGVQTWPDGARYEGEFKNDKREGHGLFIWPSKVQYEGDFTNGKRHGHGVYTWPNGAHYEGGYVEGQKDGPGIFTYPPDPAGQVVQERQVWSLDKLISSTPKEVVPPENNRSDAPRPSPAQTGNTDRPKNSRPGVDPLPPPGVQSKPNAIPPASAGSFRELPDRDAPAYPIPPKPLVSHTETIRQKLWSDPETGITLAFVPGGCFSMGNTHGESNEQPPHEVCLDPFWMGIHEITQRQWRQVIGWLPEQSIRSDHLPVGNVSWSDVEKFVQAINKRSGIQFRLPTEAQWEFACTGGGIDQDNCGKGPLKEVAWVEENANNQPHPPGELAPNRFGLFDMTGNLWEWAADWYSADYYRTAPRQNPTGPTVGLSRVFRGGGWLSPENSSFATMRHDMEPNRSYQLLGFRLSAPRVLGSP